MHKKPGGIHKVTRFLICVYYVLAAFLLGMNQPPSNRISRLDDPTGYVPFDFYV